jgi:xanthine dehydrogenase accessory factor
MFNEFYQIATELKAQGDPFAAVTVVRNEAPSSGKTGDKAIVKSDGILRGWIGGGCVHSIMMKEVNESLLDGKPRLVRISPNATEGVVLGIKEYKMTCHSGGSIDLYIEPVLPKPHLIVIGKSVIGRALMRIAKAADYRITLIADDATPEVFPDADVLTTDFDVSKQTFNASTFLIVATQGDNDEKALAAALSVKCRYVGFISSKKKRDAVFTYLKETGISDAQLAAIHAPIGLDINGKTPEEVAISILAEIIKEFRNETISPDFFKKKGMFELTVVEKPQSVINPVCGMSISKNSAKYTIEHNGQPIYFCCDGCKIKWDADPEKYIKNPVPVGTGM